MYWGLSCHTSEAPFAHARVKAFVLVHIHTFDFMPRLLGVATAQTDRHICTKRLVVTRGDPCDGSEGQLSGAPARFSCEFIGQTLTDSLLYIYILVANIHMYIYV
jgi:hypothetical protein